jgi:hypothetical protein
VSFQLLVVFKLRFLERVTIVVITAWHFEKLSSLGRSVGAPAIGYLLHALLRQAALSSFPLCVAGGQATSE